MSCAKYFFSTVIILMSLMITINSCDTANDLSLYNPILTARNEKDLGNVMKDFAIAHPGIFPVLNKTEYPEVYTYVMSIMRMVEVKTQIKEKFDWEVTILDDNQNLNAFSLPGGKIFITTGLLKFIDSEHQLFALIAHEAYYADRIDQTGIAELSTVMRKLKEYEEYNTLGTRVFIEVIDGNSSDISNMISYASQASYEPLKVLEADQFSLDLICDNFLYSAKGIKEMIIAVENDMSISEFTWFENKPPVPNTLINSSTSTDGPFREQRVEQIDDALSTCGSENTTQNMASYNSVISLLP